MQFFKSLVNIVLLLLTTISAPSSASLIINGGFEDNKVPYGSWRWFSANQVNGWDGSNIEIWHYLGGEQAYQGSQFAELNAHPRSSNAFSIYQDFETAIGQTYYLSFAYQARQHSVNEAFLWEVIDISKANPSLLASQILDDHTKNGWSIHNSSFEAISSSSRIKFTSITPTVFTQGNFLDDIKITAQVAEPPSFVLVCFGLCSLLISRRLFD